ncbi:MAG: DUF2520 domain-containing protein [Dethiobacter sp.]|jgi:predicted short-subunit dehydrogenase-like oxidoreductase (DUF2520 family)|nr:DUF2520 domain-containing protein [Dethiobacter sp.]
MRIAIVGAGNVGTALTVLFEEAGHEIAGVASRSESSAAKAAAPLGIPYSTDAKDFTSLADVVFLTTPDRFISKVCNQLAEAGAFSAGTIVAHTSGAHSSSILKSAAICGARTVSFHPLQTFATPEAGIKNLPGSYITVEGDIQGLPIARQLVADLNCQLLEIPTSCKPLYHAAAAIVSNYFTALVDYGLQVMIAAGVNREDALPALYPLIDGSLRNIARVGVTQALTGPISRGDSSTVDTHLRAMSEKIPQAIPLYRLLGLATVDLALAKGTLGEKERNDLLNSLGAPDKTSIKRTNKKIRGS